VVNARADDPVARAWEVLAAVADPEIPVLSVVDLGIVREVRAEGETLAVTVTPTYSGCPATQAIETAIRRALAEAGIEAKVCTALAPAWTTDWMTTAGRAKLERFGIAPPGARADGAPAPVRLFRSPPAAVACPNCGADDTERLAEFGSTACKALYRCRACREPFDYFKPI
jgi:ring-1,2-phenylacetyl-CoA epoxidase subunit PaaD